MNKEYYNNNMNKEYYNNYDNNYNMTDDEYININELGYYGIVLILSLSFCPQIMRLLNLGFNKYKNILFYRKFLKKVSLNDNELLITNCCICLEDYKINEKYFHLECNHKYHEKCLKLWLTKNNTCPICRYDIL
jgi:hypothetical protein